MPTVALSPTAGILYQAFTTGGLPLNAGLLYTYIAGGTTPQATYTTSAGNVQNANPIVLGADGRPPNEVWLIADATYRFDLKTSAGSLIASYDNVIGINAASAIVGALTQNLDAGGFKITNLAAGSASGNSLRYEQLFSSSAIALLGTLTLPTTMGVGGVAGAASGAGITFPATQSASTNANTLDDYEEGTWTPAIGGSATYSSQAGRYVKVGKIVYLSAIIAITAIGSGSATILSGLPFPCANSGITGNGGAFAVTYWASIAASVVSLTGVPTDNASTLQFNGATAAAATATAPVTVFQNSAQINFGGTYEASA